MADSGESTGAQVHGAGGESNVNYRYFVDFVTTRASGNTQFRVLDFGCGHGSMVKMLRDAGVDAYGADVFYEGAEWNDPALEQLKADGIIGEIAADGAVPFEDAYFDLIVSNQVFEHVEDLVSVNRELGRLLNSPGSIYHHFPSREVLREGHIGIPLAHRFRPGRLRTAYTRFWRRLGLGTHKHENTSVAEWTDAKLEWIDTYCFYRPYSEIRATLGSGYEIAHHEIEYCRFRAAGRPGLSRVMNMRGLEGLIQRAFRRLGFMAIEQRRAGSAPARRDTEAGARPGETPPGT